MEPDLLHISKHGGKLVLSLSLPCSSLAFEEFALEAKRAREKYSTSIVINELKGIELVVKRGGYEIRQQVGNKITTYQDAFNGVHEIFGLEGVMAHEPEIPDSTHQITPNTRASATASLTLSH